MTRPAPLPTERAFHTIGVANAPRYWVLSADCPGQTLAACRRDIRWQERGGEPRTSWAIAYWDADAQTFREWDGDRTFTVTRGPYTVEAHARFMAQLAPAPINPDAAPAAPVMETRFFRAMARKVGTAGAYSDEVFECRIEQAGGYHLMIERGIAAIRAQGFETLRIIDQSARRECVI